MTHTLGDSLLFSSASKVVYSVLSGMVQTDRDDTYNIVTTFESDRRHRFSLLQKEQKFNLIPLGLFWMKVQEMFH